MTSDATAALCRLEETAACHTAEDRRLRRAVAAQQCRVRGLLQPSPSPHAAAATALHATAAQHRRRAAALRAKVLVVELWDRLVLRAWFVPVVLEGFFAQAMAALSALRDRVDAAARALSPARAVRFAAGGVVPPRLFPAPRPLRAAVALAVRVAGEFGEDRAETCGDSLAPPAGLFAGDAVVEVLRIVASRVADPRAADFFAKSIAGAPPLVHALRSHTALRRAAALWPVVASPASAARVWYAGAMRGFLQARARETTGVLVRLRQQQERGEARWRTQRAAAAAALRELPAAAWEAAAVGPSGESDAAFDAAECPLWVAVQGLRLTRE